MNRPKNAKDIQAVADRDFRILADLLGVKLSGDFKQDRAAVDRVLNGGSAGSGLRLGEHPPGRASTLDELVTRYRDGEIADEYELQPIGAPFAIEWFDEEDIARYDGSDGFHCGSDSYSFTKLWYQILGEGLSLIGQEEWAIQHGGLRWEWMGEGTIDHSEVETVIAEAYVRYGEVADAIASGYQPVMVPEEVVPESVEAQEEPAAPDFTTDDLLALLGDED